MFLAEPVTVPRVSTHGALPQPDDLRRQFKELFAAGARYQDTGGIHAAALSDGAVLRCHAEDIGRHNAVDKVIGAALLADLPIAGLGLLVTGRISAELAFKAARANLAWVATPSVPSTLADAIARRFDWEKKEAQYANYEEKNPPIPILPGSFDPLSVFYSFRSHAPQRSHGTPGTCDGWKEMRPRQGEGHEERNLTG